MVNPPARLRLSELDALRGIAAMTVVLHHLILSHPLVTPRLPAGLWWLDRTPLHVIWAGHEAVVLFFVLSGFVLSLPQASPSGGILPFYLRRVFRIYPAFLVALLVGIAGDAVFGSHRPGGLSQWFYTTWTAAPDLRSVLTHAFLITPFAPGQFDPVLWSLNHEMRVSLIFPLLLLAIARYDWRLVVGAALGASAIGILGEPLSLLSTSEYLLMFVAGILMARHRDTLAALYARLPRLAWVPILVAGCCLYTVAYWLPLPGSAGIMVSEWAATLASCGFVALALWSPVGSLLRRGVAQFLGRISYSLYLLHALVLLILLNLFVAWVPLPAIWVATLVLAIGAAYLSYRLVEVPGSRLGKRLARRLPPRQSRGRLTNEDPATAKRQGRAAQAPA